MRCTNCELHKDCKTVLIEPDGDGDIVVLGEAPGAEEDKKGIPFIGESGSLLRQFISQLDIPEKRFRFTNAVRCRPPDNRTPSAKEIKSCLPHLFDEFINNPPKYIIAVGGTALKALRKSGMLSIDGSISQLHGKVIQENDLIIFPIVHPAFLLRNPHAMEMYKALNEFEKVVNHGVLPKEEVDYQFSTSTEELREAIKKARESKLVAYDIETTTLHPREDQGSVLTKKPRIICFSLTWEKNSAFGFWLEEENYDEALEILHTELLEDESVRKIIQHAKFELMWSMSLGRTIKNMADTMLMHWHTDEKNGTHGLGKLALNYTDLGFYDKEIEEWKKVHKECDPSKLLPVAKDEALLVRGSYGNIPPQVLLPYNCMDTDATLRVYKMLLPLLNDRQLWIIENVQIPSCYPFADMELNGVTVDWDYTADLDRELPAEIKQIEKEILNFPEVKKFSGEIYEETGKELNFNSTPQIARLLFEKLGMQSIYNTPKGKPSTDKHVLDYLAERHPVPKLLKDRRTVHTLHSTFVQGAIEHRRGEVIHTSYGMAHTETGRPNSQNPNLQNIPRNPLIKNMFVSDPGELFVQVDYSQIELRVMAIFSGDKTLLGYFKKGLDVHRMIASKIHKKAPEDISKEERVAAKRTVFGLCYGQSAQGLATELGIPQEEADDFLKKFFREFPSVKRWMQATENSAHETGQVETLFGRVRRLKDAMLKKKEDVLRARAMRQAINAPIQGTATDMLSFKMAELWNWLKEHNFKSRFILTVHDSLGLSVPIHEAQEVLTNAKRILEDFSMFEWATIPILCDMEIGLRWGDLSPFSKQNIEDLETGTPILDILSTIQKEVH